jgi:hypothetical protein
MEVVGAGVLVSVVMNLRVGRCCRLCDLARDGLGFPVGG